MAYVKNNWVDREGTTRYHETIDEDGALIFTPDYEKVTEIGTPVNADNMNHIEEGIEDHENRITVLEEAGDASNFLNKTQITNCLLEVPQRIKLELNDGVLTLKAGSEVIVPNGFEDDGVTPKFDYVTVESDLTWSYLNDSFSGAFAFYEVEANKLNVTVREAVSSGTSPATAMGLWYDSVNNYCKLSDSIASNKLTSLPIGLITNTINVGATSIDQVFNGMGYIGNTEWLDKGVKGLIPNGRNEDGTLRNIEITIDKVYTYSGGAEANNMVNYFSLTRNIFNNGYNFIVSETQPADSVIYSIWYQPSTNLTRWHSTAGTGWEVHDVLMLGSQDRGTNGVITSSNPKQPFRAVDYSDYVSTPHIVETYKNNTSWYRIWSDGWCEQGGNPTASNGRATVTFLKPFADTSYSILITGEGNAQSDHVSLGVGKISASSASLSWDGSDADPLRIFWEAKGKIS